MIDRKPLFAAGRVASVTMATLVTLQAQLYCFCPALAAGQNTPPDQQPTSPNAPEDTNEAEKNADEATQPHNTALAVPRSDNTMVPASSALAGQSNPSTPPVNSTTTALPAGNTHA